MATIANKKNNKKRNGIYSEEEIYKLNSTSRHSGIVGQNAIVPRVVSELAKSTDLILDFGAGKTALHANILKNSGFSVIAYDIGQNFNSSLHDPNALNYRYDIVYASNVLNVQPSPAHVGYIIHLWEHLLKPHGILIVNYPQSPRYPELTARDIELYLNRNFSSVYKDRRFSSIVYICSK